ncbi:unnamed protein product [Mytilus coruscus]|uniref:Uncharacterized protein n=1 Tax=Mytilus coruscus TaxID=42192 RepID=A0A6J8EJK8_MYTCO|nr:unnamed protein product [Mytilus coruscus]
MHKSFTTKRLQRHLENHYGDYIVIHSQQGQVVVSLHPFHLGLAIQVYHKFGSKRLIEILNAHGFCVTYTELRRYLTSVANHEISRISGDRYIPGGIRSISEGGRLIQEGSDNIDINAETLDGKNTFYSLARAVFQTKSAGVYDYGSERIKRGIERSLTIDDTTASLTDAIPYSKPKCRSELSRRSDAFDKLQLCDHKKSNDVDQIWIFSRLLSRGIIELPTDMKATEQKIPFWTGLGGFHSLSCFLASIGKLWADGGLRDLLVDSGVYAGNTAELMLNGKEFNRAVRGFTLVCEALEVLFISAFIHWCRTFDCFDQIPSAFWNMLLEFHTSICDQTDEASVIITRLEKFV